MFEIICLTLQIKDETGPEENVMKPKRPFYSLAGISIGQFREAQKIKDAMPSLFPNYFATFLSLYRTPVQNFKAEVRYVPSCEGCVKCAKPKNTVKLVQDSVSSHISNQPSIWSRIFSVFQPVHGKKIFLPDFKMPLKK